MPARPLIIRLASVVAVPALVGLALLAVPDADAVIPEVASATATPPLAQRLADPDLAARALEDALGRSDGTAALTAVARSPEADLTARGWAIVGLTRASGGDLDGVLRQLHEDGSHPGLVRTWAAAARIQRAPDLGALTELAPLMHSFGGLDRPLRLRVEALAEGGDLDELLALSQHGPFAQALAPTILEHGSAALVERVYGGDTDLVRRQAAAYVASFAQLGSSKQASAEREVLRLLAFSRKVKDVPWSGGALFVPSTGWQKAEAQELVGELIAWYWWCDKSGRKAELDQLWNNLYSVGLLYTAGYDGNVPRDSAGMLQRYEDVMGAARARDLHSRLGADR